MNRQTCAVDNVARPHHHQRRGVSDSGLLPGPSSTDVNDSPVIYNVFSPLNSSSEGSSSADQQRCVPATSRRQEDAACLREPSFSLIGSPSSVAELEVFETFSNAHVSQPILCKNRGAKKKKDERLHPLKRRFTRGVDSPKKLVETRNVYISTLRSSAPELKLPTKTAVPNVSNTSSFNSKQSSLTSASCCSTNSSPGPITRRPPLDDLLNELLEAKHLRMTSHTLSKTSDPRDCIARPCFPKKNASHHRRQNTSDSTRSAVAAVARGASKAVAEDNEITWGRSSSSSSKTAALDRPLSRPRRQHTAGSADFPSENECIGNSNPKETSSIRTKVSSTKAPARIARPKPPRHDCTSQLAGGGCAKIKLMKRASLKKAAEENASGDRPVPCPLRQSTTEKSTAAPVLEISLAPKTLFDDSAVTSDLDDPALPLSPESVLDNAGDDDSLVLEDVHPSPHKGQFNHNSASDSTILTWLNMPQHRWSNSEPVLKVPSPPQLKRSHCRSRSKSDSDLVVPELESEQTAEQVTVPGLGRQPSYDESTSCNDPSCDDRMFQAWMKMPPRACTTHTTIDNDLKTGFGVDCTPTGKVIDIAEQWVAAATSSSAARRGANNISDIKDVSGVAAEVDDNVSLPSFFMDCTGLPSAADDSFGPRLIVNATRTPLTLSPTSKDTPVSNPTTVYNCHGTSNIIETNTQLVTTPDSVATVLNEAASNDLKKRTSLPPLMPHRRKPSLFVDDSIELESAPKAKLWSSMPVLSHSTLPSPIPVTSDTLPRQTCTGLRSLWPPLHCEKSIPIPMVQPKSASIATTSRQDISATKRASLPPIMPHRRKPSLFLDDDLASHDSDNNVKRGDAYNGGKIESMWSSLPIFCKQDLPFYEESVAPSEQPFKDSSQLPPTMPHRRKPSLHVIEQEGEGGTIELMLPSTDANALGAMPTRKLLPSRSESFCSIVLKEGEAEI